MANLNWETYAQAGAAFPGALPGDFLNSGKVSVGASSTQSAAIGTGTVALFIRLISDVACRYAIGANPTADADSRYLPASTPVDQVITPGHKLAVIEA